VCKTQVDPTRVRRVAAWALGGAWPPGAGEQPLRPRWWLGWCSWGYLGVALVAALLVQEMGDRWLPATLLLFGPRYLLILPLVMIVPAAIKWRRALLVPITAAGLVILFPVMSFRTGWRSWLRPAPDGLRVRVMTFNAQGGDSLGPHLPDVLTHLSLDVVAFQECGPMLQRDITQLFGWAHREWGELCLLSRYPIVGDTAAQIVSLSQMYGNTGEAIRYDIELPIGVIHLVNLHLETPRKGLEPLLTQEDASRLGGATIVREAGSHRIRLWVDSIPPPVLVVGDFNMPVESAIYRRFWGDFDNAFDVAGFGVGGTRAQAKVGVRIDHILFSRGWRARRAFVGPPLGSDHRPMVAELYWVK
jgi:vancomycin resistance protein VanJ